MDATISQESSRLTLHIDKGACSKYNLPWKLTERGLLRQKLTDDKVTLTWVPLRIENKPQQKFLDNLNYY
jgi:hypothetical protein